MDKRRLVAVWIVLSVAFAVMLGRLLWLQTVTTGARSGHAEDLTRRSVEQRGDRIEISSGRADFVDRRLRPITGETYASLLLFPAAALTDPGAAKLGSLLAALRIPEAEWRRFVAGLKEPRYWPDARTGQPLRLSEAQQAHIVRLQIPGVAAAPCEHRYASPFYASQLIGFLGENPERVRREFPGRLEQGRLTPSSRIGGAGLEKTFEPYLHGLGGTSVTLFTDGLKRPVGGIGYREAGPLNPNYPLRIETTLDLPLQRRIEEAADDAGLQDGAIVVLDAKNADILASVSRPQLDPNRPDPGSSDWNNRVLQAIVPGSVFKTVVAAAALEEGLVKPDESFFCDGELGRFGFSCWEKGGHGRLTFAQGFAQSCNLVFARVAERLTPEQLETYARKLGLLRPVGWTGDPPGQRGFRQLDGEQSGQLFAPGTPRNDDGVRVQTAVGQRDVRITPLQAANLVVTLLHGGEVRSPRAVSAIRYRTGRTLYAFRGHTLVPHRDGISRRTAGTLRRMMERVVREGTGASLRAARWKLAGKSGTAQAGASTTEWFVGYGPADRPRYAAAVVAQGRPAGAPTSQATAVFRRVMDILAAAEASAAGDGKRG